MKVPSIVLAQLRAPLLAIAVAGCSTAAPVAAPAEPLVPEPDPVVAAAIDPVSYDLDAETERLERADRLLASAETRRANRIAEEEAEARRRAREESSNLIGYGSPQDWVMAACGRG